MAYTDESVARLGVAVVLANDPKFELLSVHGNARELLAEAAHSQPHVIVYGLRSDDDLDIVHSLRRTAPSSAIILWSREVSCELARQAMDMGVRGFLSTTAPVEDFKECIHVAATGELWMERSLSLGLLNSRPLNLSRRQSELVGLLVQGLKNKEIAAALGISVGTVKAYLTTLFEKVGAKDRFELALFGMKNLRAVSEDGGKRNHRSIGRSRTLSSVRKDRRTVA